MTTDLKAAKGSVIFAIVLLISINAWYYLGQIPDVDHSPKTPIAFLVHKSGESQQRSIGQKYWQQISLGQAFFENTQIDSQNSQLVLALASGVSVDISAQSMINIIQPEKGHIDLQLLKGQVDVKTEDDSQLKIALTPNASLVHQFGEARYQAHGNQISVTVRSGKVIAQTSGGAQVLSRGDSGRLTPTQFFVEEGKITVIEPREPALVMLPPNRHYTIRWQSMGPAYDDIRLLSGMSPDSLESTPYEWGTDSQEIKAKAFTKMLYWKIVARSKNPENPVRESALFHSQFAQMTVPTPVAPDRTFYSLNQYNESHVPFEFENPGDFKTLIIEISKDPNFLQSVQRSDVNHQEKVTIKIGDTGNLYWRLVGKSPINGEMVVSAVKTFAVINRPTSDMNWAKSLGWLVDWEVELEAKNNKVIRTKAPRSRFTLDATKTPSDVSEIKYRFCRVDEDILKKPWIAIEKEALALTIAEPGFYYLQMMGLDQSKKAHRLFRNDLVYFDLPGRDLAQTSY